MLPKKIVSLDFHGVLAANRDTEARLLEERKGIVIPAHCRRRADIVGKEFPTVKGKTAVVTLEEFEAMRDELYGNPTLFAMQVPPMQGAKEGFQQLQRAGHLVRIVTNAGEGHPREGHSERGRHKERIRSWLRWQGLHLCDANLHVGGSKTQWYDESDIAFDNELGHLKAVEERGNKRTALVLKLSSLTARSEWFKSGVFGRIVPVGRWGEFMHIAQELVTRKVAA